jgi:hypothetical protein
MLVLDIDLDFFLDRVSSREPSGGRQHESYEPWCKEHFRLALKFLGLSTDSPVRGRVLEHHDEAFYYFRDLIRGGDLHTPFDLVHVDAHSDLGMGDSGYVYLSADLLHQPLEARSHPERSQVLPGNYLLFVAACRWVRTLTFIQHDRHREDRPWRHFRNRDPDSGFLELAMADPELLQQEIRSIRGVDSTLRLEPAIPAAFLPLEEYQASGVVDLAVLSHSPDYTPISADPLLEVFREYIREE